MKALALCLWLLLASVPFGMAHAEPGVVTDSPAWNDMMALPVPADQPLPFYAADVLQGWGRGGDAHVLRGALLMLQLRLADGHTVPKGWRLADVWQQAGGHLVSEVELNAAWQAARARSPGATEGVASWPGPLRADAASLREMASRLAGRPPVTLGFFLDRNAGCERQGTCPPARIDATPKPQAAGQRERESKERRERRNSEAFGAFAPFVYVLIGVVLHVLITRQVGGFAAWVFSLAQGPAVAYAYLHLGGEIDNYGGLIIVLFLGCSGVFIGGIGRAIYGRWFANL